MGVLRHVPLWSLRFPMRPVSCYLTTFIVAGQLSGGGRYWYSSQVDVFLIKLSDTRASK